MQGIGHSVPERILSNNDLSKIVETNDEWITSRTGISERRITGQDETAATLSVQASENALRDAGITAEEVDLIICATVTGDHIFPSASCLIQRDLGAVNAAAFDLGAACAGFVYSVQVAASLIESGQYKNVLVIGVDTLSKFVDWEDRSTCILFGDAAGAVVLQAHQDTDRGVLKSVMMSDGSGAKHIDIEVGGSKYPFAHPEFGDKRCGIFMNGQEVYRFAVKAIGDACCKVLEEAGMTADDIDLFVPHQANIRIINSATQRIGLPEDKVFINVDRYGNTSAGSVPLALSEAVSSGKLKKGMNVLTVACGAGLVWGANIIRW